MPRLSKEHPALNLQTIDFKSAKIDNVGAARRVLMKIASIRLLLDQAFIATTDADTIVDPFWIANLMSHISSQYGLICGDIRIHKEGCSINVRNYLMHKENYNRLRTQLECLISPDALDPLPRHAHNSGPNLAIRKGVYTKVDGIPPLQELEDIALYDKVCQHGFLVRHCLKTKVVTSSRLDGRVSRGFGSELKMYNQLSAINYKVEGLQQLLAKFIIFEEIRNYYRTFSEAHIINISSITSIERGVLNEYFFEHSSAISVINFIDRKLDSLIIWKEKYPLVHVAIAEEAIYNYIVKHQ